MNGNTTVVVPAEVLLQLGGTQGDHALSFVSWDDGEVYTALTDGLSGVPGTLLVRSNSRSIGPGDFGDPGDLVRLVLTLGTKFTEKHSPRKMAASPVKAYVRVGLDWRAAAIQVLPIREELFSPCGSLLETDALAWARVAIIGLGSVGSPVAVELAKCGVMHFFLMDFDRFEVRNIVRCAAPLSHVGRYKTKSVADLIHGKNPYCEISTWEAKVTPDTAELLRKHVRESDIVICAADGPGARDIVNRLCVEEKRTCIMAGLRERAYGGQVLVIRPGQTLCHACYVKMSGGEPLDREISSPEHAERVAYADRPVPVEPGLSLDIAPINLMVTKLVVQELLKGRPTSLRSLDEDLVAPFYLWLNRRDADSPFATLEPLGFEVNGMRILRFYGVPLERDPECDVCGDFVGSVAQQEGIEVCEEDSNEFL